MRRLILTLLICLLLLPLGAFARETPKQIYTIQKGDTLWGISERFITDPWYWPNLWANNPFIRNPHLIYPGQKVAIYDGRIELLAEYPPETIEEGLPEPVEEITFEAKGDLRTFISTSELQQCGRIVDTVDNRIMMTKDDQVFVQMSDADAQVGKEYLIYRVGDMVKHPATGQKLGHQIIWLGTLQLAGAHEQVYSGLITRAAKEITRGAILLPMEDDNHLITLKSAASTFNGTIVAASADKIAFGQHDIFYVDFGTSQGLEAGNMLTIVRPRKASELALQDRNLKLPDTLLGRALVVKAGPDTAAALVLKSSEPIYRGDLVYTETE
ncbi:MAG: LysM peptidoglycan-binding domain-containing protein [Desulfuromonadaceae bacterium]|nr:LysM peptidoglycan-binding domain-containing protein [Desulfuromonadaceae bacterium]